MIAAAETDMAQVALAGEGLEELEALAILALQHGLLDSDRAERVFGALARIGSGLTVVRKWMKGVRYGDGDERR